MIPGERWSLIATFGVVAAHRDIDVELPDIGLLFR
jgi:hypothetical protein